MVENTKNSRIGENTRNIYLWRKHYKCSRKDMQNGLGKLIRKKKKKKKKHIYTLLGEHYYFYARIKIQEQA